MPETRRRPFTLLDAAAMIAALAIAMAWFRHVGWNRWSQWGGSKPETGNWVDWKDHVLRAAMMVTPFASALAPTLLALQLRPPRLPLRRLVRRPGTAACLAASLALLVRAIELASFTWKNYLSDFRWWHDFESMCQFLPHEEGLAVAVAWLVLGIALGLHPEPTWIDRAGRAVGGFFLACLVLRWFYYW
ncbi:MAG: hypothetical protein U0800_09255 [Isosphaeraceae bacterium]